MKKLGRYGIISELGKGAMGVVYKAIDPLIDRTVAIKTINLNLSGDEIACFVERFNSEAKSAGRLNHPNIVTIYDVGRADDVAFIAMEHLEGQELKEIITSKQKLQPSRIVEITAQVADALAFAHDHGVVHRDIKPANIMVLRNDVVKIMDFGIAMTSSGSETQAGTILGSPKYMSPEQISGKAVDGRSDIFSLGTILYELLTGISAFGGGSSSNITAIMYQVINEIPKLPTKVNASIPAAFDYIVSKALAKKPEERYQSARDLADDLRNFQKLTIPAQFHATSFPQKKTGVHSQRDEDAPGRINISHEKSDMRILVVDDELVSRKKMERIMRAFGKCIAVDCGEAALKEIVDAIERGEPFDLITLDISMPRMDGTEVLYEIRRIEEQRNIPKANESKVIMVSALSDKGNVITCMQVGCDSYVVKPFDKKIMARRLEELGMISPEPVGEGKSIREMIMDTILKFNQGKISMPVLPQITKEIEEIMGFNKPAADTDELVKIIEKDAVISVKIIATANTALYSGADGVPLPEDKVHDLKAAIARLGAKEIQEIVSAMSNRNMYESRNKQFRALLKKLWLHSLCCAYCCRAISVKLGEPDSGKVFLMGLTHKIGCVILLKSIGDITPDRIIYDKTELMECLNEVHTSIGAAILTDLGFGREYSEVIRLYKWSSFEKGTSKEVLIVNLADKMASKIKYGFFENDADLTNLESANALGFDEAALEKIAEGVKNAMKGIESVFT